MFLQSKHRKKKSIKEPDHNNPKRNTKARSFQIKTIKTEHVLAERIEKKWSKRIKFQNHKAIRSDKGLLF